MTDKPTTPAFKAVFFDVDGTIVLTEERNQKVISRLAEKYGAKVEAGDWQHLGGQPETVVWSYLAPRYPAFAAAISPEDFMAESRAISMKDEFAVASRPGITDTMCHFKARGLRMAAVSNAPRAAVEKSLFDSSSDHFMEFIVSEDDVLAAGQAQKPAPDPYLMAAARMGLQPHECLVIEDSQAGVMAGKAAGMTVIQIIDGTPPANILADAIAYDKNALLGLCQYYTDHHDPKAAAPVQNKAPKPPRLS